MAQAQRSYSPSVVIDRSLPAMRAWRKLRYDVRAEVIYGKLYILGTPTTYHAEVSGHIFCELMLHLHQTKKGEVFHQGVGVFLNDGDDVVVPDIVYS